MNNQSGNRPRNPRRVRQRSNRSLGSSQSSMSSTTSADSRNVALFNSAYKQIINGTATGEARMKLNDFVHRNLVYLDADEKPKMFVCQECGHVGVTRCRCGDVLVEEENKYTQSKFTNPTCKAVFSPTQWILGKHNVDLGKAINTNIGSMNKKVIPKNVLNHKLFVYLRLHMQIKYPDRDTCLAHLQRLRLKYYEVNNIDLEMSTKQSNIDLLTISRCADEQTYIFLTKREKLQDTVLNKFFCDTIYKIGGNTNILVKTINNVLPDVAKAAVTSFLLGNIAVPWMGFH